MTIAVQQKVRPRRKKHKCPPHYWIISSENVGHCKYCPEVRDFARLLQREGVIAVAGRSRDKARKEVLGKKRGRKKKEEIAHEYL